MKINAVALMRDAREKIFQETAGMSWEEERDYLWKHRGIFQGLFEQLPSNGGAQKHRSQSMTRNEASD